MTESLLLSIGASIYLLALLFRDIFWLRMSTLLATGLYFIYAGHIGLVSMQVWQVLFLVVNGYHIVRLIRQRIPIVLPELLQPVYESKFSNMSPKEFLLFWNFGDEASYQGEYLIEEGIAVKSLWYVSQGEVLITKAQERLASLQQGQFLGEMSFLKASPASADAFAAEKVVTRCWSQQKLRDYCALNPNQKHKLYAILGRDLSRKITQA